jgi:hypothetical protein
MKAIILIIASLFFLSCSAKDNKDYTKTEMKSAKDKIISENNLLPNAVYIYENDTLKQTVILTSMDEKGIEFQLISENKLRKENATIAGIANSSDGDYEIGEDEEGNGIPLIEYVYVGDCWLSFKIDADTQTTIIITMADCIPNPYCPFSSVGILKRQDTSESLNEWRTASIDAINVNMADISDDFMFLLTVLNQDEDNRPIVIGIEITNKNTSTSQRIEYTPNYWTSDLSSNGISYLKNEGEINEGIDDYHTFVVADFNFDGLEDFAILYDMGGSAGPSFSYFLQSIDRKFEINPSFPLNQSFFPREIDKSNRILKTISPIGVYKIETNVYQLNNGKWDTVTSTIENSEGNYAE